MYIPLNPEIGALQAHSSGGIPNKQTQPTNRELLYDPLNESMLYKIK